jgi:hypothetical protein
VIDRFFVARTSAIFAVTDNALFALRGFRFCRRAVAGSALSHLRAAPVRPPRSSATAVLLGAHLSRFAETRKSKRRANGGERGRHSRFAKTNGANGDFGSALECASCGETKSMSAVFEWRILGRRLILSILIRRYYNLSAHRP